MCIPQQVLAHIDRCNQSGREKGIGVRSWLLFDVLLERDLGEEGALFSPLELANLLLLVDRLHKHLLERQLPLVEARPPLYVLALRHILFVLLSGEML